MKTVAGGKLNLRVGAGCFLALGMATLAIADTRDESVIVIRGSNLAVQHTASMVRSDGGPDAAMTIDTGVLVMRPASGSFMRETTRLAAENDAREQRAASERVQSAIQSLVRAINSVDRLAYETQFARYRRPYFWNPWLTRSRSTPVRPQAAMPPVRQFSPRR